MEGEITVSLVLCLKSKVQHFGYVTENLQVKSQARFRQGVDA